MIFLTDKNKTIIGIAEYVHPDFIPKNSLPVLKIDDEDTQTINKLKAILGFVQIDEQGDLPETWYEDALLLKNASEIDSTYQAKFSELHDNADALIQDVMNNYSEVEKETWATQRAEAEAWFADNNSLTPRIDRLSELRGVDRLIMIQKVLDAITALEDLSFEIVGMQQAKEDELNAAKQTSLDALNAVDVTLTLPTQ